MDKKLDKLDAVIPFIFTNTGAPRTHRHVIKISAIIIPLSSIDSTNQSTELHWMYEVKFVSKRAYFKKYPDYDNQELAGVDFTEYVNRDFPFYMPGNSSLFKAFRFEQIKKEFRLNELDIFELTVRIETDKEIVIISGKYKTPKALHKDYIWCYRIE